MYAVTDPSPTQLPAEPFAGNEVSCSFLQTAQTVWVGTANCKHGRTTSTTYHTGPMVSLDPTQMVTTAYRQHNLIVGCDCPTAAAVLNATVSYGASAGVQPGERRIIVEQSASIKPPAKNFAFYGRLVCARGGAYDIEAIIQLSRNAPGLGQVFVAGAPAMLSVPISGSSATVTGMLNLVGNQPLAVAYVNTGLASVDVQSTTLKVSEVWTP